MGASVLSKIIDAGVVSDKVSGSSTEPSGTVYLGTSPEIIWAFFAGVLVTIAIWLFLKFCKFVFIKAYLGKKESDEDEEQ